MDIKSSTFVTASITQVNAFFVKRSYDRVPSQLRFGTTTHTAKTFWVPWRTFCKAPSVRVFPFLLSGPSCSLLTRQWMPEMSWSASRAKDWHVCHIHVGTIPCWYCKQTPPVMLMVEVHSVVTLNAASLTLMAATTAPSLANVGQCLGLPFALYVLQFISNSTPERHTITTHHIYADFMCELVLSWDLLRPRTFISPTKYMIRRCVYINRRLTYYT